LGPDYLRFWNPITGYMVSGVPQWATATAYIQHLRLLLAVGRGEIPEPQGADAAALLDPLRRALQAAAPGIAERITQADALAAREDNRSDEAESADVMGTAIEARMGRATTAAWVTTKHLSLLACPGFEPATPSERLLERLEFYDNALTANDLIALTRGVPSHVP
jgi:hypothetical protein